LIGGGGFGVVFVRVISRRKAREGDGKRKNKAEFKERVGAPQKFNRKKKQRDAKMKNIYKVQET